MSKRNQFSQANNPLTPAVLYVLLALQQKDRHGYDIMKQVEQASDGKFKLGPGTLYGTIKRLVGAGLIVEIGEAADQELGRERRRYYRMSALGQKILAIELERLTQILIIAQQAI